MRKIGLLIDWSCVPNEWLCSEYERWGEPVWLPCDNLYVPPKSWKMPKIELEDDND